MILTWVNNTWLIILHKPTHCERALTVCQYQGVKQPRNNHDFRVILMLLEFKKEPAIKEKWKREGPIYFHVEPLAQGN